MSSLISTIPLPIVVQLLTASVIPGISAWLTKKPSAWTGLITAVLVAISAGLSEWVASPSTFHWKTAVATLFVTYVWVAILHSKFWAGDLEGWLNAHGLGGVADLVNRTDDVGPGAIDTPSTQATPVDPKQPAAGNPPAGSAAAIAKPPVAGAGETGAELFPTAPST
jgi:hypothetical protein